MIVYPLIAQLSAVLGGRKGGGLEPEECRWYLAVYLKLTELGLFGGCFWSRETCSFFAPRAGDMNRMEAITAPLQNVEQTCIDYVGLHESYLMGYNDIFDGLTMTLQV